MSTTLQIEHLRSRAQHLRNMSNLIAGSWAIAVYSMAGPETWVGPTAQACSDALVALRRQLLNQQQALGDTARILDRRAEELQQRPPTLVTVF